MSEMAPERPAARRENVFTRKIGPLPMWAWVAIIGSVIVVYSLYKRKTAGATTSTASPTGTDASQVPQFVNQTFTNPTAPVAGPPGPPGAPGPPGTPGGPGTPEPPPLVPPIKTPPFRHHPNPPVVRSERLRHKGNIMQIAKRNNIDVEDLLEANPELQKFKGTGRQLPVGTVVRIPPAAA